MIGNATFKAGFDFSSGWSAAGFLAPASRNCDANIALHRDYSVYVTLFGHRADVATIHGDITAFTTATRAQASMRVVGQDLFTPVNKREATAYQVVQDATWGADFGASMTIVIIAIPVKIAAGIAGSTGAQFGLGTGNVSRNCAGANPAEFLKGDAFVRPHAWLDAFASASVVLAVAETGIRRELTLLSASVPFRLGLALEPQYLATIGDLIKSRELVDTGRAFVADVIAFTAGPEAQDALRAALSRPPQGVDETEYALLIQRFAFVFRPTPEALDWLAERRRSAPLGGPVWQATTLSLGSTVGRITAARPEQAQYLNLLLGELDRDDGDEPLDCRLRALGNSALAAPAPKVRARANHSNFLVRAAVTAALRH